METKIFYSKEQLARYFGDCLIELTEKNELIHMALSGGSTPETIFDVLSQEYKKSIKWDRIKFFWGDERCVPPDHAESNYRMTREHLFDHTPVLPENIFRIKGELSPEEARADYRHILERELPKVNGLPCFDVMLLGMGDDGHTASIFPHEIALWDSPEWCEIGTHPKSGQKRITLTGRVINNSRDIAFLVTGEKKAPKVHEILNQKGQYLSYPAARVNREKSLWLLDQEAAQWSETGS
ncbi:6-phosphogluconolactonase [Thermophagus sp. OGC60D27]|uniref:6-phosphogluconolactonase n=1 Tax=Thermophagus sp. OGC60D27 TaxID=3458415 RepID=UPI004037CEA6